VIVSLGRSEKLAVHLNDGSGAFGPEVLVPAGAGPRGVATGDFDHDGDLDLATARLGNDVLSVIENRGSEGFAPPASYPTDSGPGSVVAADVNVDGALDLVVGNVNVGTISVFIANCR